MYEKGIIKVKYLALCHDFAIFELLFVGSVVSNISYDSHPIRER
jgi:hypothetical protein